MRVLSTALLIVAALALTLFAPWALARRGGDGACEGAARAWLGYVELICPAPREPADDRGECRPWHHASRGVTEQLLGELREACGSAVSRGRARIEQFSDCERLDWNGDGWVRLDDDAANRWRDVLGHRCDAEEGE
jgi:hypothetical protein